MKNRNFNILAGILVVLVIGVLFILEVPVENNREIAEDTTIEYYLKYEDADGNPVVNEYGFDSSEYTKDTKDFNEFTEQEQELLLGKKSGDEFTYVEEPDTLTYVEGTASPYTFTIKVSQVSINHDYVESTTDETTTDEVTTDEVTTDEDSKDNDSKDNDSKDNDSKDEDSKDEDSKDNDSKDEDSKDNDSKDEDSKDNDSKDEDSKDNDSKDEDNKN